MCLPSSHGGSPRKPKRRIPSLDIYKASEYLQSYMKSTFIVTQSRKNTFDVVKYAIQQPCLIYSHGPNKQANSNTNIEKIPTTYWRSVLRYINEVYPTTLFTKNIVLIYHRRPRNTLFMPIVMKTWLSIIHALVIEARLGISAEKTAAPSLCSMFPCLNQLDQTLSEVVQCPSKP